MCCNRQYISGYIPDTACEVSCVGRCSVTFFMWRLFSVCFRIRSLHHEKEHIRDLFRHYFTSLLRNLEVDIVKYIRFRGDSYVIFLTYFISCTVVCKGPYSCLLFKICNAYTDFGLSSSYCMQDFGSRASTSTLYVTFLQSSHDRSN
jgi:hypothetical protein